MRIFVKYNATLEKNISSKISNIVANIKFKKLKTVNLRKARRWWNEQSNTLKILKTNIITDAMSLAL
jgi:hypothetical protein